MDEERQGLWRRGREREREREPASQGLSLILSSCFLQKYSLAPNIMAMVSSFNQLALVIPSEILEEQTPHARAKVISNYIKVSVQVSNTVKLSLASQTLTPRSV